MEMFLQHEKHNGAKLTVVHIHFSLLLRTGLLKPGLLKDLRLVTNIQEKYSDHLRPEKCPEPVVAYGKSSKSIS